MLIIALANLLVLSMIAYQYKTRKVLVLGICSMFFFGMVVGISLHASSPKQVSMEKALVYLHSTLGDSFKIDADYWHDDILKFTASDGTHYLRMKEGGLFEVLESPY